MKKIILFLGIIFLLTSCYSNPKDLEKIEKLENQLEKQKILNDDFQKTKDEYSRSLNLFGKEYKDLTDLSGKISMMQDNFKKLEYDLQKKYLIQTFINPFDNNQNIYVYGNENGCGANYKFTFLDLCKIYVGNQNKQTLLGTTRFFFGFDKYQGNIIFIDENNIKITGKLEDQLGYFTQILDINILSNDVSYSTIYDEEYQKKYPEETKKDKKNITGKISYCNEEYSIDHKYILEHCIQTDEVN